MKVSIETLKDTFEFSYNAYSDSRAEALNIINLFHNRQYTDTQLAVLSNRGQPKETFNVIKMYGRMLIGYYSTLINTIKVSPDQEDDIMTASILNDLVNFIFEYNSFNSEGDKLKLDLMLTGLMCAYVNVEKTKDKDEYGRPKYKITVNHVPSLEIVIDPMSRLDDYSDARFIHRFKWVDEDSVRKQFGQAKLDKLEAYRNHVNVDGADFADAYGDRFNGKYNVYNNYLIVHTIMTDDSGKTWSIFWCDETILDKKEITYKEVKNPYRVHKLQSSNIAEYYGIFREVSETQHAINQALLKIQLMVNTQKAFVEEGAVENLATFTDQFNRVNAVIPVKELAGIRIENLTREVMDQYTVIDKALTRIQRLLSINDSFLGMAYASDSGAKVQLQKNSSMVALRYVTAKIEQFYRLLGWDVLNLIKQYYTAHDVIRVADTYEGFKWVEINKPIQMPTGQVDPQTGQPLFQTPMEEVMDPESGEPMKDENGNYMVAPIPYKGTEIAFTQADLTVDSVAYNDEDEKNQMLLEQFVNGPVGNILSQVNPVGYFKAAGLAVKNVKSKYSMELAGILEETANQLGGNPMAQQAMQQGQVPGQMPQAQASNQLPGRGRAGRA